MEDQLISFETAKLAKEKGFDIPQNKMFSYGCRMFESVPSIKYCDGDKNECSSIPYNWNYDTSPTKTKYFSRPTQSLLQKWLIEVHNIHIEIQIDQTSYPKYCFEISKYEHFGNWDKIQLDYWYLYKSYEEALEQGLQEALKLI